MAELRLKRFLECPYTFDEHVTEALSRKDKLAYLIKEAISEHQEEKEVSYGILREIVSLEPSVSADIWKMLAEAANSMGYEEEAADAEWNAHVLGDSRK